MFCHLTYDQMFISIYSTKRDFFFFKEMKTINIFQSNLIILIYKLQQLF